MTKEGKLVSRRRKCLKTKAIVENRERREEWGVINTCLLPMASTNVAYLDSTSTPCPTDENKLEHLMLIQQLEIVVIIASTLRSWRSHPWDEKLINRSDSCLWNWKDRLRRTRDIMAEMLKTPNDAQSINHAIIFKKYKFKFKRSLPYYPGPWEKTKTLEDKCCMPCQPGKPRHYLRPH